MPFAFNRVKSPPKARGTTSFPQEITKHTEDNHSLLAKENNVPQGVQNVFFGHFNGFTLTPIKKEPEIHRPAPPAPKVPSVPNGIVKSPIVTRSPTTVNHQSNIKSSLPRTQSVKPVTLSSAVSSINNVSVAPALPPLNPGSNARPIISSPILENSTCTAKELLSPLRNAPKIPLRPAPEAPKENKRPLSSPDATDSTVSSEEPKKAKEHISAINRIASFLKSNDKKPQVNTNSLPRSKINKSLDKSTLRTIEISKPIPQTTIDIAKTALPVESAETKNVVMRAQSMRGTNVTIKPNIQTFGSMRQPHGLKRPVSIPSGTRPKSPPPPRPPVSATASETKPIFKVPSLPGYQPPSAKTKQNQYDDCLNESIKNTPSSDNIYAVIEETPISSPEVKTTGTTNSSSTESVGLLGEIVSEIQNRNFESIYSTNNSKNNPKENKNKLSSPESETYVNTSSIYKSPESVYSNTSNLKSSASSTSSGYITPAAVNPPIQSKINKTKSEDTKTPLSTFKGDKGYKPYHTTLNRPQGPIASTYKQNTPEPTTPGDKPATQSSQSTVKTSKTLNRQVTPPNLRTRKPSPTRTTTPTPKNPPKPKPSNSPDLVTSCSNSKTTTTKPPDVLNVKKPISAPIKPTVPKTVPKVGKSASAKNPSEKKTEGKPPISTKVTKTVSDVGPSVKSMPTGARLAAKQQSNVAALQQKFENKPPISAKTVKK